MENTRLLCSLYLCLIYIAAVSAFSPLAKSKCGLGCQSNLSVKASTFAGDEESVKMPQRSEFLAILGTFVTGSIISSVEPAHATVTANPSSSMYLSDEIKTLDFSLPSYDAVNTLKTDGKALGVEDVPEPSAKTKLPKKKKEASSGGSNPMASVLPSMNKSGPKKKAKQPKEAAEKAKKPQKEAPAPKEEYETMDFGLPSYSESTGAKQKSVFAL